MAQETLSLDEAAYALASSEVDLGDSRQCIDFLRNDCEGVGLTHREMVDHADSIVARAILIRNGGALSYRRYPWVWIGIVCVGLFFLAWLLR